MIEPIVIRPGEPRDVDAVSMFLRDVWRHTYAPRHGLERVEAITRRWHGRDSLLADIGDGAAVFLLAFAGDRLVGHAFLQSPGGPVAWLRRLYVDPDCQRRGLGGRFLFELEARLGAGAETMELEVDLLGRSAIAFYRSKGFVECGRTRDCGDGESGIAAMVMRRSVSRPDGRMVAAGAGAGEEG
ncbi:MAG: GNAT family N-acetyltransferase [Geminicoccaceae bacterium]|nr:GNAT family N-acetyltransferase [Geminicoccaceae bacterium]